MKKSIKKMNNKKGFTLIELIVVIVILGILAAILVPRLSGFSETAQASACEANRKIMNTAMATVYAATGSFPADTDDADFLSYLDGGVVPACPGGGTYSVGTDGEHVVCSEHTD